MMKILIALTVLALLINSEILSLAVLACWVGLAAFKLLAAAAERGY